MIGEKAGDVTTSGIVLSGHWTEQGTGFDLDVGFGEKDPLVLDGDVRITDGMAVGICVRVSEVRLLCAEGRALEAAFFALPDKARCVHADWLVADRQTLLLVFAERPGTFTKVVVVISLARTAKHGLS